MSNLADDNTSNSQIMMWYLGNRYPIIPGFNDHKDFELVFDAAQEYFVIHPQHIHGLQKIIKQFYYRETKRLAQQIIRKYEGYFPKVRSITIKDSMVFWGQCNGKQEMNFHWRLAMVDQPVLEYVVIHELCHMHHLNHDRSFWRLVGKHCPNYETLQSKLAWYEKIL